MFVCLFWSIVLAIDTKAGDRVFQPRIYLIAFMLTATILYFGHCAFFNHKMELVPTADTLYCAANLAVYPLFYLYICSLSLRRHQYPLRWMLLLPSIVLSVTVGILYLLMSSEEIQLFSAHYLYHGERASLPGMALWQATIHDMCKVMFALLIIPVFVYGSSHLREYNRLVSSNYADTEGKTLKNMHIMLVVFIITSILSFVANIIGRHAFADSEWLVAIPSSLFSALLFSIGFMGYKQQFCIKNIEADEHQADAALPEQPAISELRQRLEQLMESEQLYRQPNLKIGDLVQRLGSNRNYIYLVINREMRLSFSEYVNRMRIDYASLLISQHPGKSLSEIGEKAGFTSSTSFYRNFKLYKGMGPKEYCRNIVTRNEDRSEHI